MDNGRLKAGHTIDIIPDSIQELPSTNIRHAKNNCATPINYFVKDETDDNYLYCGSDETSKDGHIQPSRP